MKREITIIVPAYNEAAYIGHTLQALRDIPALSGSRLIVVDDGSTDRTALIADAYADTVIRLRENKGKGQALRCGIAAADKSEVYLFIDADTGGTAVYAAKLLAHFENSCADMIIGRLPRPRRGGFGLVKWLACREIHRMTGRHIVQPLSGQRALSHRAIEAVRDWNCGFGIEVAMTIDVLRAGLVVEELPLPFCHRELGKTWSGFWHRGRQYAAVRRILQSKRVKAR
ncbi:glycosyl transferase family 2 [Aneurinibacillus soli]|uniref:Glucosyl-3-phosphoglycerate synthase n=1 Tax=Aneurinibacillus soli TaxID=1500254 RepID=A0A0U4WL27_9BACL|nr:glycosyltransferase family 2 protein [Aneurinibacillus soli]PYE62798.1 glycosyl transferase family 2 [Aneurinibacillus soli]BAU29144.1 Undecaprenyl-phosphate mannosyltransferase [Aneurinibacillus soli]